jgi:NitT/TauT family transport system permease protein
MNVLSNAAVPSTSVVNAEKKRRARLRRNASRTAYTWGSVFAGLALWQFVGTYIVKSNLFLATPLASIEAMGHLWQTGELPTAIVVSGEEYALGFILGAVVGVAIGLLIASWDKASLILSPWISGFYASPIIALAPLLILWFGIGIWSKIAVVFSLVVFPIIINTEAGLLTTDPQLIEAAKSFGANRWQIFAKVSLPGAAPMILAGLRLGVGRGLIGVVVGELAGSRAGLGFLINTASEVFNMPQLFASLMILAAAGILLTAGFQRLERILVPWKNQA